MRYRRIEIFSQNNRWHYSVLDDDQDRVNVKTKPFPIGFYWFPKRSSARKAFEELQDAMIERHEREIQRLQKSLTALKELRF